MLCATHGRDFTSLESGISERARAHSRDGYDYLPKELYVKGLCRIMDNHT